MQQEEQQQRHFDERQQRVALELLGVLVEEVRAAEHHQVADDVDDEIEKRRSPVRPMRILLPTEESKTRSREDINRKVYPDIDEQSRWRIASGVS